MDSCNLSQSYLAFMKRTKSLKLLCEFVSVRDFNTNVVMKMKKRREFITNDFYIERHLVK